MATTVPSSLKLDSTVRSNPDRGLSKLLLMVASTAYRLADTPVAARGELAISEDESQSTRVLPGLALPANQVSSQTAW